MQKTGAEAACQGDTPLPASDLGRWKVYQNQQRMLTALTIDLLPVKPISDKVFANKQSVDSACRFCF
jgi:hypothetical protein